MLFNYNVKEKYILLTRKSCISPEKIVPLHQRKGEDSLLLTLKLSYYEV